VAPPLFAVVSRWRVVLPRLLLDDLGGYGLTVGHALHADVDAPLWLSQSPPVQVVVLGSRDGRSRRDLFLNIFFTVLYNDTFVVLADALASEVVADCSLRGVDGC